VAKHIRTHEARIAALEAMSGDVADATVAVGLKEHFESRLIAIEKSTDLAANLIDKRLESMNEFRDALRDQTARFVTRDELDLKILRLADEVGNLKTFRDRLEGKASAQSVYIAYGIAVIGLALSIISLLLAN